MDQWVIISYFFQDSDSGRMNLSELEDPDETMVKTPATYEYSPR